jgi:hypothetical protein
MLLMDRRKLLCYFRHTDWKILPQSHLATDVTHCTLRHNLMHKHYTSYPWFYSLTHSFQYPMKRAMSTVMWDFILSAVVTVRITNIRDVTPCILVDIYRRFRRTCGLYCQCPIYKIGVQKQFGITQEFLHNFINSDIVICILCQTISD